MSILNKSNLVWLVIAGTVGLAGCVPYRDKPLSAQVQLNRYIARNLESNELQGYVNQVVPLESWPPERWSLSQLTLAAFFYNPALEVSRARWAVSEASVLTASERPNPTLGLVPGVNSTTGSAAGISPWIVGLVMDIPIETAHKRGYRTAQAELLSEAARLEIAQAAWDVRRQVREAILNLYAATQIVQNLHTEWQLNSEKVLFLTRSYEAGEVSGLALAQFRLEEEKSHAAWLKAVRDKSLVLPRLAQAIGIPAESLDGIQFDFGVFENELLFEIPTVEIQRQALLNRADLLAALAGYQATQYALREQIAKQYPNIQIGPGYEFDQSDNKWTLGLSVTLPIFNRNQAGIALAEAVREEAAARFQAVQAEILAKISQAVTQYVAGIETLHSLDSLVSEMAVQKERVKNMVQAGESLDLDRIDKELEYNTLLSAQLEARIQVHRSLSQIEDVMQTASDLPGGAGNIPGLPAAQQGDLPYE